MSAAVETQHATTSATAANSGPRKRKKRASAVGAAVDCFSCSNRHIKCDRRRPYCSQCLDAGQDCSGYKTQLTWGVGVASRGKLRGLTLPVAGTQKASEPDSPPKAKKRRESNLSASTPALGSRLSPVSPLTSPNTAQTIDPLNPTTHTISITPSTIAYNDRPWQTGPNSAIPTSPQTDTNLQEFRFPTDGYNHPSHSLPTSQHQVNYSQPPQYFQTSAPMAHPTSYPLQSPSYAHISGPLENFANQYSSHLPFEDTSPSEVSSTSSAVPKTPAYYPPPLQQDHVVWHDTRQPENIPKSVPQHVVNVINTLPDEDDVEEIQRDFNNDCAISDSLSHSSGPFADPLNWPMVALSSTNGVGKTPRMKYLVNYYAEVIAPVIVAFDGPNNPFRTQILNLALKSETLQHAIAALSASNIRRRQESGGMASTGKTITTRRSSMAHRTLTDEAISAPFALTLEEQIREETFHKRFAVQQLNKQLADRLLRHDDAILATLLVLCLFDMCDSGVANFQAQFSGVKKLLTVRGDELGLLNPEAKWMTRMFAWYDAFSATVNDREAQFSSYQTDPSSFAGEWSFANLAGIDGRLFATISRLGRLNSLVQGRSVTEAPATASKPPPPMPYNYVDGEQFNRNDWMRILEDENLFSSKTETYSLATQFWQEWREVRQELQTWSMPYRIEGFEDQSLTPEQRYDLGNVSEAFRFAALLYTERLANPTIPSSDERIQVWVRKSLHYIRLARSDTYLLWAIFITGAECIDEAGRNVVRERARDIQKDSGFVNNASCLDILEKVWEAGEAAFATVNGIYNTNAPPANGSSKKSAFIFRDVMLAEKVDGEYFVL